MIPKVDNIKSSSAPAIEIDLGNNSTDDEEEDETESTRSSSPTETGLMQKDLMNTSGGSGSHNFDCFVVDSNPNSPLPPPTSNSGGVGGGLIGPCINYHMKENEFGKNFKLLRQSDQIKELQTIIRDRNTTRSDFKFYADRLIRLVIEESLNQLPFTECEIVTPTRAVYKGLRFEKGNCGVSIVRSGESMEQGLRDCCRSIRIGKILVERNSDTHETRVVYARFPEDISNRKVILMYPIMSSGNTTMKAVKVLKEHQVAEENIILANLFCTPNAVRSVFSAYPNMKILTSEVHPVAPNHFGTKYFGTD